MADMSVRGQQMINLETKDLRFLLPLILLASAAWAAAHDTGSRVAGPDANAPPQAARGLDQP
jgi:hypothetical protein